MQIFKNILLLFCGLCLLQACGSESGAQQASAPPPVTKPAYTGSLPIDKIKLPEGFKIDVYAEGITNARSLCLSPKGTLFVSNRKGDKVYALQDTDGDYRTDKTYIIAQGLDMPNGVAFKDGDLYVAEVNRIIKFPNIEEQLANPPAYEIINDQFPSDYHHGWKFIAFGPDGKLYVPVGAPCNVCERKDNPIYATITRMNADGSGLEIVASGVRNTVGFTWHPDTKELWFTDNGRDMMGDDMPACELNHAPKAGMHFGFPYCHQGDVLDPEFGKGRSCDEFTPPAQKLGPHVAPLGLRFYTGEMFPEAYRKHIFIAEHGSWNRSSKIGYRITLVKIENGKAVSYEPFATGWLQGEEAWGRPVDVQQMPDGSLMVSDDFAGAIYRVYYEG